MKKIIWGFLLFSIACGECLFSEEVWIPSGFRKLNCASEPIAPLSKRPHFDYRQGLQKRPIVESRKGFRANWSGYVSYLTSKHPKTESVTHVSGFWTVPKLSPSHHDSYCSCWVGMDGYFNDKIEQIGTEHDWINGRQENYAWYAFDPESPQKILGFPIAPQDIINGGIYYGKRENNKDTFTLILINYTKQFYYVQEFKEIPITKRTSAEWVVEAPTQDRVLPLARFSSVSFSECLAQIKHTTRPIDSRYWKHERITMRTEGEQPIIKAEPSVLFFNGKNFTVTWNHK